jgi:hypothetical protein
MALAAAAIGTALAAAPAGATTTPGVVYIVKATMTPAKIVIAKDRLTRNGMPRYPRGAVIRYAITNTTAKTLVFQMWSQKTLAIKPGHKDSVLVNWNYRGRFPFRMLYHGKPFGSTGYVTIY